MKTTNILLFNPDNQEIGFFKTVQEAQNKSENYGLNPHIYTLLQVGKQKMVWDTKFDTVSNLHEIKKFKTTRKGIWTELEVETLKVAVIDGLSTSTIAGQLHRSVGSVYQKIVKLDIKKTKKEEIKQQNNKS